MACLVLKGLNGERRVPPSPDGQYRYASIPGEKIVGIDPDCGGDVVLVDLVVYGICCPEKSIILSDAGGRCIPTHSSIK